MLGHANMQPTLMKCKVCAFSRENLAQSVHSVWLERCTSMHVKERSPSSSCEQNDVHSIDKRSNANRLCISGPSTEHILTNCLFDHPKDSFVDHQQHQSLHCFLSSMHEEIWMPYFTLTGSQTAIYVNRFAAMHTCVCKTVRHIPSENISWVVRARHHSSCEFSSMS